MKKILPFLIIPYLILMGVIFYFYFGPGLLGSDEPMAWQGFQTRVPAHFQVKIYHSKGWEVYSLQKTQTLIKIAVKDTFDVTGLPRYYSNILYRYSPSPAHILFVASSRRGYEMVYACRKDDVVLYFSVFTASPYSGSIILKRLLKECLYNGQPVSLPEFSLPLRVYGADLLLVLGLTLPGLIIAFIFYFSGRKPATDYFDGDPIVCEESYVYYIAQRKYRRRGSLGYLVLTSTRLMIFQFRRPVWQYRLYEPVPDIRFEGKRIVIQREKDRLIIKPTDITRWQTCIKEFLMKAGGH